MKKFFTLIVLLASSSVLLAQQGAAINTSAATADPSAILDVSSLDKGVLIPRLTESQRNLIANPANGLMVYQTDNDAGFYYNAGTSVAPVWLQLMPNPAANDFDMGSNKIINLATCTDNFDAANKAYVDNALSAGGGGSSLPSMLSSESDNPYSLSDAVDYCENLNEGGYNDWRLPLINELSLFFGSSSSANYLWTRSLINEREIPVSQNYISARLSDGKYNKGDKIVRSFFLSVSGSTASTSFVQFGSTLTPSSGNWFRITNIYVRGSQGNSTGTGQTRFVYNDVNGNQYTSPVSSYTSSAWNLGYEWQNTEFPLNVTSIFLEGRSGSSSYTFSSLITISGYEVTPINQDGNTLLVRCVR